MRVQKGHNARYLNIIKTLGFSGLSYLKTEFSNGLLVF